MLNIGFSTWDKDELKELFYFPSTFPIPKAEQRNLALGQQYKGSKGIRSHKLKSHKEECISALLALLLRQLIRVYLSLMFPVAKAYVVNSQAK